MRPIVAVAIIASRPLPSPSSEPLSPPESEAWSPEPLPVSSWTCSSSVPDVLSLPVERPSPP